jgi:hypothetical protein
MGKWATELAEHVINFVTRSAIKSQVLADSVADWTPSAPKGETIVTEPVWEVQCDGAYCHLGSAAAAVLKSPSGIKLRYALRLNYDNCTNNVQSTKACCSHFGRPGQWEQEDLSY